MVALEAEQVLRKIPLFAMCTAYELKVIASRVQSREFPIGAKLCAQGERACELVVVDLAAPQQAAAVASGHPSSRA